MVCLGNICRSPIAEGVMKKLVAERKLDWQVDSAGTNGYHIGEAPHKYSQKVCKKHGIDISNQRARRFSSKDFEQYDLIFVMAADVYDDLQRWAPKPEDMEKVHYFLDALYPNVSAEVPDPWYGDESGYEPVYQMIAKGCEAILDKWTKS